MERRKFITVAGSVGVATASVSLLSFSSNNEKKLKKNKKLRVSYVGFFREPQVVI